MKFAPHIRHVANQQRDEEYTRYRDGLTRLAAELDMQIPPVSRDEFEEMSYGLTTEAENLRDAMKDDDYFDIRGM
jgi:hypothetical protein